MKFLHFLTKRVLISRSKNSIFLPIFKITLDKPPSLHASHYFSQQANLQRLDRCQYSLTYRKAHLSGLKASLPRFCDHATIAVWTPHK